VPSGAATKSVAQAALDRENHEKFSPFQ
jgi:hypothetical protein